MYSMAEIEITKETTFMDFSDGIKEKIAKVYDGDVEKIIRENKHVIHARSTIMRIWNKSPSEESKRLYELFCSLWTYIKNGEIFGKITIVFFDIQTISDYHIRANVYVPAKADNA